MNRPDVVATLEQVRGEGVTEGVACDALIASHLLRGAAHGSLDERFMQMMPAFAARPDPASVGLPGRPIASAIASRRRNLSRDHIGQPDLAPAARQILLVQEPGVYELFMELARHSARQHRHAIVLPLRIPYRQLSREKSMCFTLSRNASRRQGRSIEKLHHQLRRIDERTARAQARPTHAATWPDTSPLSASHESQTVTCRRS